MLSAKPWQGEAVLQFCGAQLLCFFFGLTLVSLLQRTGLAAFQPPDGFGAVLLVTLGFQGATWVLIPFFLRQHQADWRGALGFREPQLRRALLTAAGITVLILPVVWLLQYASIMVLTKLGWPPEEQAAVALIAGAKSWWMRLYMGMFAVVLAPVAEEFIFRGMLYPFIKQFGFPRLAWIGVSLAFALVHADAAAFVPLFVLAIALTWLYEKTDNLLAPIAAHALFNALNLVVLVFEGPLNQFLERCLHSPPPA